ncbi:MAG: phosphoenolpyruvate carboxykinase [Planctomycetes bacterium DG_23]|nr:MAG: phosphoenolpyruvate carboxykinase [Planctomycetes bacterium DG_23]
MEERDQKVLEARVRGDNFDKLMSVPNPALHRFIADAIDLCAPDAVFVCTDAPEDIEYIRQQAIACGEETPLEAPGHTFHFDGPHDLGRDREKTKYLVPAEDPLSKALNQVERDAGLREVRGLLKGSMKGRTMIVRFFSLGPTNSVFSIPCVQCTDSFYVAHSEDLLYRAGYEEFRRRGERSDFFRMLHSAGRLDQRMVSIDVDKKRIYIDYTRDTIYSVNTQYAGNTVGLKKLALRLAIRKADREGWLAEHMFLLGARGPNGRKTYLAGAFPSACGKTSTAMLPGETILGDDIAYLRNLDGQCRAVNAEFGIFGIIQDVTPQDDPIIHKVLVSPGEVIFSNVLVKDGKPYWLGMGRELPTEGMNSFGPWHKGKTDETGNPIPPAAKNARYALCLDTLENVDAELESPLGVPLEGIMYGGRDHRTSVPLWQSFDWEHGIVTCGASLETVTTYATVGEEGIPEINLMSIQDFVSIPLGKYIQNNLDFGKKLTRPPLVFGVNYFLSDRDGHFLNDRCDKAVWVKWMELRIHGEVEAIRAPTGYIPKYEDLRRLFRQVLDKEYTPQEYVAQFTMRVPENLRKLDRVEKFHRSEVPGAPAEVFEIIEAQRERLRAVRDEFGDYVAPFDLQKGQAP